MNAWLAMQSIQQTKHIIRQRHFFEPLHAALSPEISFPIPLLSLPSPPHPAWACFGFFKFLSRQCRNIGLVISGNRIMVIFPIFYFLFADFRSRVQRLSPAFIIPHLVKILKGITAQFSNAQKCAFCAIYFLQKSRFTSSKPSIFAIASDTKFTIYRAASFVRCCPRFSAWCLRHHI